MGITLELPENEDWIQDVTYTTISDEIAQIQYYDAIAEADVTLRAGKGEVQELAGRRTDLYHVGTVLRGRRVPGQPHRQSRSLCG